GLYRQQLIPCELRDDASTPAYKQGGVYVVIGGAGGIGEAFSEHVVRRHAAQMVWLGRRPLDASIEEEIERLSRLGPAPLYLSVDARDRDALERARREILANFGAIDGLVHAAIALSDQSLANMDEALLSKGLSAKVDTSVRMAQVFANDALDFVLF